MSLKMHCFSLARGRINLRSSTQKIDNSLPFLCVTHRKLSIMSKYKFNGPLIPKPILSDKEQKVEAVKVQISRKLEKKQKIVERKKLKPQQELQGEEQEPQLPQQPQKQAQTQKNGQTNPETPVRKFKQVILKDTQREELKNPLMRSFDKVRQPKFKEQADTTSMEIVKQPENPHVLRVALVGAPNAGKSTLVNQLVGDKISIVSPKPQTTREETVGVLTKENVQLIFWDTPGIIPLVDVKKIQYHIVVAAWHTVDAADLVLTIVDTTRPLNEYTDHIMKRFKNVKQTFPDKKFILVLNKVDMNDPKQVRTKNDLVQEGIFDQWFETSALHGTGVEDVRDYLLLNATKGEWEYNAVHHTNQSALQLVTETIREKLFLHLHQEVPYSIDQENYAWTDLQNGDLRIDQDLIVPKESMRKIVIGKHGAVLQLIRTEARDEIAKKLNKTVHLFLNVKVAKHA